ncbi:MAG TPA: DinB family protein [Flavisolibacter sp.]|nr:DinB family protein [Flavisolibacter sp.]
MANIDLSQVPSFYHGYIQLVPEGKLNNLFENHQVELLSFLKEIPENSWGYRYTEGKWTIGEMVQHIIDAERIFAYRALRFARKDSTPLAGFDENTFAASSKADQRNSRDLMDELSTVQKSSAQLFGSFDDEQLDQYGVANNNKVSVRAIGYILIGHALHHMRILKERYRTGIWGD